MTKSLLAVGMTALFCGSNASAQSYSNSLVGATLIYSNAFNGAAANISNTPPNFATNLYGGTNNAVWIDAGGTADTNAFYANGSVGTSQPDSILLPFTPQTNQVYTLTASVTFSGNPGTSDWIGAGFAQHYASPGIGNARFADSGVNGYDFAILTENSGNVQYFAGPHATVQLISQNGFFPANTPATHTMKFILDTTGTKWVIAGFVDGTQASTNYTYTANPSIAAIGMTQTTLAAGGQVNLHWNSLTLSAAQLVITKQPVSASLAAGSGFTNTILVAAATPSYQWYQDGQPLPRPGQTNLVNGATNATLVFSAVQPADASTNYYAVVTNSSGSVTSAPATLTVFTAPVIAAAYPVTYSNVLTLYGGTTAGGTNYPGSTPTFSVAVIAQNPRYQWLTNGVAVAGATSTSFTFTNCPLTGPTSFAVAVSNVGGSTTYTWPVSYISAPTAPFPSTVLGYQPVGYWRLNEGPDDNNGDNGRVALDYASGNDGMYSNAIVDNTGYSTSTDPTETSVLFSSFASPDSDVFGIQAIDFSAPAASSASFSVQAWINGAATQTTGAGIISKGYNGAEQFTLDVTNNKYGFLVRDAAGNPYSVSATNGPDGNWHLVVGVCDEVNGAVSLYVDGTPAGSVPIAHGVGLFSSTNLVTIGARSSSATSGNDLQFKGFLDDVGAFNYALSLNQIVTESSTVASVPPYFVQRPPTSIMLNAGDSLNLSAIAGGTAPIGYYWTDVNAGTNVAAGATNALPLNTALTVASVPKNWNGDQLELTVTNAGGTTNIYVSLTVFTNLTIVDDLPASIELLSGASYTYSIGLVGPGPYAYQWYHAGTAVPNQTNATYTVTAAASGSTTYYVVVSNGFNNVVTSAVSTVTTIAQLTNAYAAGVLQLNPGGYWPMHEVEAAAPGNIETNRGTLGPLGTAYYPDWLADYGAFTRQVPGAIVGDADTALHFNYNVGNLANGAGTWTNEIYIPHTSPLSTLNPPFSVECWLYNTNASVGQLNQSVWGQHGWEGFNAGYAGSGTGASTISGMQLAFSTVGLTVYGYFNGVQNPIISAAASLNAWFHVVVTCDASTNFTLYVNGTARASGSGVGKYTPDYWTPLTIGGTRGGTRSAIVTVDEFAVYTNVISDVSAHYNDGIGGAAGAYFHDVTNDNPVIYLRMDAPPYTEPSVGSWPELVNYGSVGSPGVYSPGTMPGIAAGPTATNGAEYVGLSGTNVPALSGVSSFADAGYASAYNPTGSNANFTVTAMFRGNPCDNRIQSIVSHGTSSWQLNVTTNGTIVFNAGNGNAPTSGTGTSPGDMSTRGVYNDGKWHQVVAINTTNVVSIYVDGALDTNGTPSGITPTSVIAGNSGDVMIGADPSYTSNPTGVGRQFAGQVCEVAFLGEAITATQVQDLYELAVTGRAINTTPVPITFSVSNGELTLGWPSDHIGWTLQAQTNNSGGLSANWVNVPNSTLTNQVVVPISPANGSVFYRLHYQQ